MEKYNGIYIFEGIDNVGKTTIIQALKMKIKETRGNECINVAFPGNEPGTLGNLVYHIHHHEEQYFEEPINEASLQLLHIASHIDLIQRKLKMLSNSKEIVLLDRFWWSAYVYGLAGELDEETICTILAPELLFWKDIDIKKIFLLERNNRKRDYDIKKENAIIIKYRELAEKEPKCIRLNNDEDLEKVVNKIYYNIFEEQSL